MPRLGVSLSRPCRACGAHTIWVPCPGGTCFPSRCRRSPPQARPGGAWHPSFRIGIRHFAIFIRHSRIRWVSGPRSSSPAPCLRGRWVPRFWRFVPEACFSTNTSRRDVPPWVAPALCAAGLPALRSLWRRRVRTVLAFSRRTPGRRRCGHGTVGTPGQTLAAKRHDSRRLRVAEVQLRRGPPAADCAARTNARLRNGSADATPAWGVPLARHIRWGCVACPQLLARLAGCHVPSGRAFVGGRSPPYTHRERAICRAAMARTSTRAADPTEASSQ